MIKRLFRTINVYSRLAGMRSNRVPFFQKQVWDAGGTRPYLVKGFNARNLWGILALTVVCLATSFTVFAHIEVPALFSDNMVLQEGVPATIWGWAHDGDKVTVSFRGQKVSTMVENLKWSVKLRALKAGGPDTLTISTDDHKLQFTNVLVGEVWICSGQSNMEWPLNAAFEPQADIDSATNEMIRLFNVPNVRSDCPTVRINSSWKMCSPKDVGGFSAVGFYFGRDLQKARKVPVGLIQSDWGGTPAEAWTSREGIEINQRYREELLDPAMAAFKKYQEDMAKHEQRKAEAKDAGKEFKDRAPGMPWRPSELYNGMIAPLIPFTFKGAIWYQGESNAGRAEQYRHLFPDMIRSWRREWGNDFPFLFVQLAPYMKIKDEPGDSSWAELREAQLHTTEVLPHTGMAVITDVGDPADIHPKKKQPVGARLALAARAIAYDEKIEFSGPNYLSMDAKSGKIVLHFTHVGKGLEARGGELKGFAICGEDNKFVWAKAEIAGDTVIVSSGEVANPVAVRYGWADCPVVNLWNKDGFPASPFRTDNFPLTTAVKK